MTLKISRKMSLLPTIITYDLSSSTNKYSPLLLSSASKVSTPLFVKGIVVVKDTYSTSIVDKGIAVVDIMQDNIEVSFIHLASAHHFSLSRYPSFFLAVVEMLCSIFHHDPLIYTIYNTDYLLYLQSSVITYILQTCGP